MLASFQAWYQEHQDQILSDYFEFLRFPSISTDPKYKGEIHKTALWLQHYLKKMGMAAELWETTNHPVVFATHLKAGPDRPTVLIYNHYDVQPVDPLEQWKSPPFEPVIRDGKVYARGASDNKGQCFYFLTALKAFLQKTEKLNVNLKLFIEGEEECGSSGSTDILKKRREELKADYVVILDMGIPEAGVPAITLGLRGIVALEVTCRNSRIDLHSGVHGGVALNPNRALATALSKLWDAQGKIAVPGFYDAVTVPRKEELSQIDQSFDEDRLRRVFGIQAFQGEPGWSLWASNKIRPTIEINGISGGYTGEGFKTVIPSQAKAKISCRLVPNQDPQKTAHQVADFLKTCVPPGIELSFIFDHGGKAVRTSPDTKVAKLAAEAYAEVFKKPCLKMFCAATVPIVADLAQAAGGELALMGVSLDEDDIHAPNEHFGLDQFYQGYQVMTSFLTRLNRG